MRLKERRKSRRLIKGETGKQQESSTRNMLSGSLKRKYVRKRRE